MSNKLLGTMPLKYNSNNKFFYLIGATIFIAMSLLFASTYHFEKHHTPEINNLSDVKFEVISTQMRNSIPESYYFSEISSFSNIKNQLIKLVNDKHWVSYLTICSAKQKQDINKILKELEILKINVTAVDQIPNKDLDLFYSSLISNIENLQKSLGKRHGRQQLVLFYGTITTFVILLVYIFTVFITVLKRKKRINKILIKSQKNNYFLKESQNIAKLLAYTYDFKTKKLEATGSFLDFVGTKPRTFSMKFWISRIHPKDRERISNLFTLRTQAPSTTFDETYRIVNDTNGEIHWVHHVVQDIKKDSKGNILPTQGVIQDITQYKLAEEKIKRSNTILNKINSMVLVINCEGDITYASKGIKKILGYKSKEVLDQGWWQLTYPDKESAQKVKDANCNYFFNTDSSFITDDEFSLRRIKTKKGKYKWIKWSFTKESENSFIAIGVDVTETHEKSRQFKFLAETAHDAIVLIQKGEIFEANKAATKMFGYSKKEMIGKSIGKLMPKNYRKQFLKELKKINKEDSLKNSKIKIEEGLSKNGETFPIEISFNSWKINSNSNSIYCVFIRDITEQKYEEQIKEILFNITSYAQEKPSLDALLPFIIKSLSIVIDTSTFFVSLYDDDKQNFNSYEKTDIKNGSPYVNFPKGESLFDYVIENKKSLLYKKSTKINGTKISSEIKSKCWIGVPLIVKQKAIGVMSIRSYSDENAYSKKDVSLLELVASTVSQVIQQIKDFEKINLLNQALVQSSAIIIITNTEGEIEYVNPSFTKITGYESDEVLGKNSRFLGVRNINKHITPEFWKTINKGESWEGELTNLKKDGSPFTVLTTIAPVKNNTKEITHYISVQEDVTERRKLEHQFINGFVEAQEIERQAFGEELHDGISQILSAETMYINVLIKENQDRINGKAKFLTKIRELNLSAANEARNIAHGLMSNQLMKTGLIKAIENICLDYTNTKNIKFIYYHKNINEKELSKEIKINIFRVVQEITTNIVRHSKATETTITVSKSKHQTLNLIIKDNGVGIDYDKTKSNHPKGVGFENIKRRIALLNGTLNIETSLNNGLCYTINVPL